jgi:hypothetical protein
MWPETGKEKGGRKKHLKVKEDLQGEQQQM